MRYNLNRLPERIRVKLRRVEGCLIWEGFIDKSGKGYGRAWYQGRSQMVHRVVYTLLVGPIPNNLPLDHLIESKVCTSTRCCEPSHLEPVTLAENFKRSRQAKVVCVNGHPLSGDNLRMTGNTRICITCRRATALKWWNSKCKGSLER